MNSRRPSKPNLPRFLSPPSFLLQRGYAEPISSLASRISLLYHSINQCILVPSKLLPLAPNEPSHKRRCGEKRIWSIASQGYDNGKEESRGICRDSKVKIVDESILFFSRVFLKNSLWKLSPFGGYKDLYIVG